MSAIPRPVCHSDGTVSFWCPRRQAMVPRQRVVPRDALAVQPDALVQRVRRHLRPTAASPRESAVAWRRRLIRRVCLHLDGGRIAS